MLEYSLLLARAHESVGPWGNALLTLTNVADFVIATPAFVFCVDTEQSVDATRLTEGLHVVTGHVDGECAVAVDNPALCADHRVCSTNGILTLQHRTYRTVRSPYNSGCLAAKCCPNFLFLCQSPPSTKQVRCFIATRKHMRHAACQPSQVQYR